MLYREWKLHEDENFSSVKSNCETESQPYHLSHAKHAAARQMATSHEYNTAGLKVFQNFRTEFRDSAFYNRPTCSPKTT